MPELDSIVTTTGFVQMGLRLLGKLALLLASIDITSLTPLNSRHGEAIERIGHGWIDRKRDVEMSGSIKGIGPDRNPIWDWGRHIRCTQDSIRQERRSIRA